VAGKIARHLLPAHSMGAIFYDDNFLLVSLRIRQRLYQNWGLFFPIHLWGFSLSGGFYLCRGHPIMRSVASFRAKRAIAGRNSGIPAALREDVGITVGNAAGRLASAASISPIRGLSSEGFTSSHLVKTI